MKIGNKTDKTLITSEMEKTIVNHVCLQVRRIDYRNFKEINLVSDNISRLCGYISQKVITLDTLRRWS